MLFLSLLLSQEGRTPLWWAAHKGQVQVTQVLLAAGADREAKDTVGAGAGAGRGAALRCTCYSFCWWREGLARGRLGTWFRQHQAPMYMARLSTVRLGEV